MLFNNKKKNLQSTSYTIKAESSSQKKPPVHRSLFLKHYELLSLIKQHCTPTKDQRTSIFCQFCIFSLTTTPNKLFFGIYLNVKYSNQGSKANLIRWFISQKLSYLFFTEDQPKPQFFFHKFKIHEYYLVILLLTDCTLPLFRNTQYNKTNQMGFFCLKGGG